MYPVSESAWTLARPENGSTGVNGAIFSWVGQGKFNSTHGMAVDRQGNLYVAEWLIGGRFIKLER